MFHNTFQGPGTASFTTHTFEILIMWLLSGLIGLLIGYVIWRLRPREYFELKKEIKDLLARLNRLDADSGQLQMANGKLKDEVADWKTKYQAVLAELNEKNIRLKEKEATLSAFAAGADDLTIIEGIDPIIEGLLHQTGIHTFQNLANAKIEILQAMLKTAGPAYRSVDVYFLRKQACSAFQRRKGHYADFAELKFGRKQLERLHLV